MRNEYGGIDRTALEAIKTRSSTRRFSDNYVELEKLDKIVGAGRFAPI